MSDKETREMLLCLMFVGIILALVSITEKKNFELKKDTLTSKPKYEKVGRYGKYEFAIKQETNKKYELRYVFSDLSKNQKNQIRNEIDIGNTIEMHIDSNDKDRNSVEMYSLKINGKEIYKLKEYQQLQKREKIGSFGIIISSIIGWLIFKFTEFRVRNFSILIIQGLGFLALIIYL